MTKNSWIHDLLGEHKKLCPVCCDGLTIAEDARVETADKKQPPPEAMTKLCKTGRSIYERWLAWLQEPD